VWDPRESSVRGVHAFFLLRGDPRAYNLPLEPEVPTVYQRAGWSTALLAAGGLLLAAVGSFLLGGDQGDARS